MSASGTPSCWVWRTMMSKNVRPSLTSSSDLALVMPMLVPRPPLSLIITVLPSASLPPSGGSGRSAARGRSATGSMSASGSIPVAPASSSR